MGNRSAGGGINGGWPFFRWAPKTLQKLTKGRLWAGARHTVVRHCLWRQCPVRVLVVLGLAEDGASVNQGVEALPLSARPGIHRSALHQSGRVNAAGAQEGAFDAQGGPGDGAQCHSPTPLAQRVRCDIRASAEPQLCNCNVRVRGVPASHSSGAARRWAWQWAPSASFGAGGLLSGRLCPRCGATHLRLYRDPQPYTSEPGQVLASAWPAPKPRKRGTNWHSLTEPSDMAAAAPAPAASAGASSEATTKSKRWLPLVSCTTHGGRAHRIH